MKKKYTLTWSEEHNRWLLYMEGSSFTLSQFEDRQQALYYSKKFAQALAPSELVVMEGDDSHNYQYETQLGVGL